VNNVLFVVQYLTKKRIISIVEQISNSCRLFVVVPKFNCTSQAVKLGYYDKQSATITDLFDDADDAFFMSQ